ncbi:hypothetical protein [Reyranella sp.]|uniref:hypothetical protein n=1 Tax=Reyranella sp. TaxID=1929291 RepID=UPI003C7BD4DD
MSHVYKLGPPLIYASSALRVRWRMGRGPVINQAPAPLPDPVGPPPETPPPTLPPTQAETVDFLARVAARGVVDLDPAITEAFNTLVARLKSVGVHQTLYDWGCPALGGQVAALEGVKGGVVASDWSIINGTVAFNPLFGMSSEDGARVVLDRYYDEIPGFTTTNFGGGFVLTSNEPGLYSEMGAFQPSPSLQVSLRGSGGIASQAFLAGPAQVFSDTNAIGFCYACKKATTGDPNAGTLINDTTVLPISAAVTALPHAKLALLAGGVTGNTQSSNAIGLWFIGALTEAQLLDLRSFVAEFFDTLEVDLRPLPIDPGDNAFERSSTTVNGVPSVTTIERLGVPPANDGVSRLAYPYWPMNMFVARATPNIANSQATGLIFGQFVWVCSGEADTDGGPLTGMPRRRWQDSNSTSGAPTYPAIKINGVPCNPVCSTKRKARYITLAIIAWHRKYLMRNEPRDPRGWGVLDYVEAGGLLASNFQDQDYWEANKHAVFTESIDSRLCGRDIVMPDRYKQADLCANFEAGGNAGCSPEIWLDHEPNDLPGDALHLEFLTYAAEICAATGAGFSYAPHPLDTKFGYNGGFNTTTCPQIMQSAVIPWYSVDARRNDKRGYDIAESLNRQIDLARGVLTGSTSYDPPSILPAGGSTYKDVTVVGVEPGQRLFAPTFDQTLSGVVLTAEAIATDTVRVTFTNPLTVARDRPAGILTAYAVGKEPINWGKVAVTVQIGRRPNIMTEAEAYAVHDWIVANGIKRVFLSRAGSSDGGDINQPAQRIRAIILGLPLA